MVITFYVADKRDNRNNNPVGDCSHLEGGIHIAYWDSYLATGFQQGSILEPVEAENVPPNSWGTAYFGKIEELGILAGGLGIIVLHRANGLQVTMEEDYFIYFRESNRYFIKHSLNCLHEGPQKRL